MSKRERFTRGDLPALRLRDGDGDEAGHGGRLIVGGTPDAAVVTSLRLYAREASLQGRIVKVAGLGSLFTPPERRGRRYGAALVESVLAQARADGFQMALLFADIGAELFTRLGFTALPAEEASCVTTLPAPWPGEPGWVREADPPRGVPDLRSAGAEDLDGILRVREGSGPPAALELKRGRTWWERLLPRATTAGDERDEGEPSVWLIDDRAGPSAYVVLRELGSQLRWLEHGALPGNERRLAVLFWAAIAAARKGGLARLEGWSLPGGVDGGTLYPIARRARRQPLLMARPLDPAISLSGLRDASDCHVTELDRF